MEDCIFCKIANSNDSDTLLWQNEEAVAFYSISPLESVHVLVVPKKHIKNLDALDDPELAGRLLMYARQMIKKFGLVEQNKVLIQGIEINHLHIHVMSDRRYHGPKVGPHHKESTN